MGECLLKGEVNQPNPILLQATVENLQGKCRKGLPLVIKKTPSPPYMFNVLCSQLFKHATLSHTNFKTSENELRKAVL